jgi:hypothetical protein
MTADRIGMTRLFIVPQSAIYSATPRQDRRPYGRKALITEQLSGVE